MEKIKKEISLETAKSRVFGKLPTLNDSEVEWGNIPYDVIIDDDSTLMLIKNRIPLVSYYGNMVLRYRTMVDLYYLIKRFHDNCIYYQRCYRDGELKNVKYNGDTDLLFYDRTFTNFYSSTDDIQLAAGNVFGVYGNLDTIKDHFWSKEGRFELDFYDFCRIIYNEGIDEEHRSIPYVNIPIMLSSEYRDNGIMTPYIPDFDLYTEYVLSSDTEDFIYVKYKEGAYKLKENIVGNTNTLYPDEDKKHWELVSKKNVFSPIKIDTVEGSNLDLFYLTKSIYDDNGKRLKFYVTDESGTIKSAVPYRVGAVSMKNVSNKDYSNYMYQIRLYNSNNPSDEKVFDVSEPDKIITVENDFKNYDVIEFRYALGCEVDKKAMDFIEHYVPVNNFEKDSVCFCESYRYTIDTSGEFYYKGNAVRGLKYIVIGEQYDYFDINNKDIENFVTYSNIEYNPNHEVNDMKDIPLFKDESINGVIDQKDKININIERPGYAAIERHNILGECRTIEDLENYRNDLFNLRQ